MKKAVFLVILKGTKTDFIFREGWRWRPCPESPESAPERALELGFTNKRS